MRKTTLLIALASLAFAGTAAAANPATGQFNVTASVQGSCRVTATPDLAFGVYDPADINATTAKDAQSSISVRCVKGITANVALERGLQPVDLSCVAPTRQMKAGAELLRYDIYQDDPRSIVWGCDASNGKSITALASNADIVLDTFGRIPAGQNVGLGANFTDTVVVTVTF